ncbi:DNA-damage-repair/toleration protein DRT102 [Pyrus ussuriensis x Pyrus communis]|uniref:DNA-damage-repair/toleration protein DRT102 n=1 Tax=Pyrus ussuriensis x Pyrus communis TaxID=2448454 RepID=A0A5N5IGT6_9ROSA|nr:DNA-damage-repair/toleration protein DRT102 [Pyrus ussuriensis x Pyrus communis]
MKFDRGVKLGVEDLDGGVSEDVGVVDGAGVLGVGREDEVMGFVWPSPSSLESERELLADIGVKGTIWKKKSRQGFGVVIKVGEKLGVSGLLGALRMRKLMVVVL